LVILISLNHQQNGSHESNIPVPEGIGKYHNTTNGFLLPHLSGYNLYYFDQAWDWAWNLC